MEAGDIGGGMWVTMKQAFKGSPSEPGPERGHR